MGHATGGCPCMAEAGTSTQLLSGRDFGCRICILASGTCLLSHNVGRRCWALWRGRGRGNWSQRDAAADTKMRILISDTERSVMHVISRVEGSVKRRRLYFLGTYS
ncbi:hypothetical protein P170DRAFT_236903 [Aspergillus steynii IBT 23096]|uniref:Uncharacterized protein n=1 Tax=Aspergillus steynii IBT 23096 TaxID=1392250 RepID=A0A2I2G2X4_9EURO|nr:uncharacterized protein P170DRAFT_236903 [Aspergillus steynii IBT 23096]PLB47226.1 hypothetical protein P170DRAFT_236903 [Aspergillus steynii IBT 23096]